MNDIHAVNISVHFASGIHVVTESFYNVSIV
jgi:hypothetical protein